MMDNDSKPQCSHCGSTDLVLGVHIGQTAEVGHIGPQYKDGMLLVGTEPLCVDLCKACGHIQRFFVKNPNHRWLT